MGIVTGWFSSIWRSWWERMKSAVNYRSIFIISNVCKACMMMVKERMNDWKMMDANLFVMKKLMISRKSRNDKMFLYFIDVEQAYDRVSRVRLLWDEVVHKSCASLFVCWCRCFNNKQWEWTKATDRWSLWIFLWNMGWKWVKVSSMQSVWMESLRKEHRRFKVCWKKLTNTSI